MKKVIDIIIILVLSILFNFLFTDCKSYAKTEEIYDVILFWGQSNMVGSAKSTVEDRYDPKDKSSVAEYSKETGIDETILSNNGTNRNQVIINQQKGTVYEYLYSKNSLQEINSNTENLGELLYYQYDSNGKLTKLGTEKNESKLAAMKPSSGINMIPEFGKIWYENTGHKVIAVFCAYGGQRIEQFLPNTDSDYPETGKRYMYEAIKTKWNAAINYLNDNNYKIGNKLYVVFQGESNINESKDYYKSIFQKVHNNMKKDLGIITGAIVETSTEIGTARLTRVENKHMAYQELIKENSDIVLGSSYSYDRYVPVESEYDLCNTKVCYDLSGNKLTYSKALERASKSVDYNTNTIHFTSAALSQIGKESAETLSEIKNIKINKYPTKIKYIQNYENLDVSDGEILVDYANIKDEVIPLSSDMISGFDNSKIGTQILTITYKGVTTTYNVEIKQKEAISINVTQIPNKTEYIQNYEALDVTGGKIQIIYNDKSKEVIDMTNDMVSGFDSSKIGTQTLTVTIQGVTTTYNIEIKPKEPVSINIIQLPNKTEYIQNYETLDVVGGKIQITYNDKSKEVIDITKDMVTGFDNSKTGTQTLIVTIKGLNVKYNIVVKEKEVSTIEWKQKPNKIEYIQNYEELDVTGGKIQIIYNDKSEETINITTNMVSGFNNTTVGTKELTVLYEGKILKYNINIVEREIINISVYEEFKKMIYIQNYDLLDTTGGKIKVLYNDTTYKIIDIQEDMVSGFDNSKIGNITITINYGNFKINLDIKIVAKEITNIQLQESPTKIKYILNYEKLDVSGGKLKITFNDQTSEIINLTQNMVYGFDNSKLGKCELTIKYGVFTTKYTIEIVEKSVVEIKIWQKPTKTEYLQNDKEIDVTGGKIEVLYNDQTTEIIVITKDMVTGFNSSILGTIEITINYKGKIDKYNIKIKPIENVQIEDNKEDETIAKGEIPKTGVINTILMMLIILVPITIAIGISYKKKYKDM